VEGTKGVLESGFGMGKRRYIILLAGWFDDTQDLFNEDMEWNSKAGKGKGGVCWADKQELMASQ